MKGVLGSLGSSYLNLTISMGPRTLRAIIYYGLRYIYLLWFKVYLFIMV